MVRDENGWNELSGRVSANRSTNYRESPEYDTQAQPCSVLPKSTERSRERSLIQNVVPLYQRRRVKLSLMSSSPQAVIRRGNRDHQRPTGIKGRCMYELVAVAAAFSSPIAAA